MPRTRPLLLEFDRLRKKGALFKDRGRSKFAILCFGCRGTFLRHVALGQRTHHSFARMRAS
jgi:hypothetical protein